MLGPAGRLALGAAPPDPGSFDELREVQGQLRTILDSVLAATVGVQIGSTRGSGVVISEDGYVLTAGHVVGWPGQQADFHFADGRVARGRTLGVFRIADAGLMKIEDEGPWPTVEQGRSGDVAVGDWCVAIGHPFGYQDDRPPVVRFGRVLRSTDTIVQTDCALVAGDSGGPLFDLQGRVIGINSRIGDAATMNFHVPIDVFTTHWDRLAAGEVWDHVVRGRDHADIRGLFRPAADSVAGAVVRVKCDGEEAALGTIVAEDGWILTKASELSGAVTCQLADGRELEARIVGIDEQFDLAMLKVDASELTAVELVGADPSVGDWVIAAGLQGDPLAVGVISVPRRPIPPLRGMLGVALRDDDGVIIENVVENSPAERAGLKSGDRITHLNGEEVGRSEELAGQIRSMRMGERVTLAVERDGESLSMDVRLGRVDASVNNRRARQNRSAVGISNRRDAFPVVLQHDVVLRPIDCGGPLLNLDGVVVGINIARGGRTESYSVPADAVYPLLAELKSGAASPMEIPPEDDAERTEEIVPDEADAAEEGTSAELADESYP